MTALSRKPPKQETSGRCPICGKPTQHAHRPFCSKRCAELDLSRWLKGSYAVPGEPAARFDTNEIDDERD